MAVPIAKKPDPQLPTSGLPSYFTILRLVCRAFEVETPELKEMLKRVRQIDNDPDKHFPKKLYRKMLCDVERGQCEWSLGVTTIAERALYARILYRYDENHIFSRTGIVAQEVVFHCLDLYKEFIPRLEIKGVPADAALWILIEDVFIPTVFAHLMIKWQRGLGHEFLPLGPWYFPVFERGHKSPVMRVFRSWMRAAGFRTAQDFGKELKKDDVRRKVDGWLSGKTVPTSIEAHRLIDRFAAEVSWLDSANDWKDRITLAIAMTNLCKWLDAHLSSGVSTPSLELQPLLVKVNDDSIPVDERSYLAKPEYFFATRLLKHRLVREGRWDSEVMNPVKDAIGIKVAPENATDEELANFRRDLYWKVESGNWLLALIKRQNAAQNRERKQKLAEPISWQETLMDIAVGELNLKLKTKRAGE